MKKLPDNPAGQAVCAVLCTLLWGSAYPMIKYGYMAAGIATVPDKLLFAGYRFVIAGIAVLLLAGVRTRRFPSVGRRYAPWAALYGLVQTGLMYLLNYIGVGNTTATKTAILTASSAFFSVMLAPLFFRDEKLTVLKVAGVLIGTAGIVVVNIAGLDAGFALIGEGFVLIAAVLNTFGGFIGKRISEGRVFEMTGWQLFIGGAFLLIAGAAFGGHVAVSAESVGIVLYLAFVSAAAFSLWTALLVRRDASRVLVYNLLIPVFGAMWSFLILGERGILDPMYLISLVLTGAGIYLVNRTKNYQKPL